MAYDCLTTKASNCVWEFDDHGAVWEFVAHVALSTMLHLFHSFVVFVCGPFHRRCKQSTSRVVFEMVWRDRQRGSFERGCEAFAVAELICVVAKTCIEWLSFPFVSDLEIYISRVYIKCESGSV